VYDSRSGLTLVRQGVYKADIAVITPYMGQLQLLRKKMSAMYEIFVNDRDLAEIEALEASKARDDDKAAELPPRAKVQKTTPLNSVRIATVDNFQGEEAKVVVVSLVRSNNAQNVGFLRTSNRINVLLSRARHALYLTGNAKTYQTIPMWQDVIGMLRENSNFARSFELQCPRHMDTSLVVSQPDDFVLLSPESGCSLPCKKRL